MEPSESDSIHSRLEEALKRLELAKSDTDSKLPTAAETRNLKSARQLIAVEIAAEMFLIQTMHLFADQADTWGGRAELSSKDERYHSEVQPCYIRMQRYAEAEQRCAQVLKEERTKLLLSQLKELESMLATDQHRISTKDQINPE